MKVPAVGRAVARGGLLKRYLRNTCASVPWLRNRREVGMNPGEKVLHVIPTPAAVRRAASSRAKRILHSLESLYALFPSYDPPSAISKCFPSHIMPSKEPRVAGPPARPSGFSALWMEEDVITTRAAPTPLLLLLLRRGEADATSAGVSSLTRAKWPRWFTPKVRSKPSTVRSTLSELRASRSGATPALHTSTSSGAPLSKNSSANVRTDASDPRSSTAGSARPPRIAWGITAATASCAFSTLRHAMITVHPAATSCLDDSSPMPEFAPVMRTVLPTPSYVSCSPRLMAEARGITTPPRPARRCTASRAPSSVDARSAERPRRPRSRTLGAAYERLERRR
mmetsp:Transcript_8172/g.20259  ORF Transcript_8172/g.20259 Transcript_8172/m.20259 type:complete len:340 (+) Transcript_8172:350-1369(+)